VCVGGGGVDDALEGHGVVTDVCFLEILYIRVRWGGGLGVML
jgi:hypothetical protein